MVSRSTSDTGMNESQVCDPLCIFRPVKNTPCRYTLTRWGTLVVLALLALAITIFVNYREYIRVGFDDTSPFDSKIDCGEATSLIQRDVQLAMLERTSPSLVTNTTAGEAPRRLIFASCNHQDKPQEAWLAINKHIAGTHPDSAINPLVNSADTTTLTKTSRPADAFIWLGDAVYLDRPGKGGFTREPQPLPGMRADYTRQLHRREYCRARRTIPITGVWDDHDMGENDGNSAYKDKEDAKHMFLDFLDFPHAYQLGYARQWHTLVKNSIGRGASRYMTRWDEGDEHTTSTSPVIFSPNVQPVDTTNGTDVATTEDPVSINQELQKLLAQQWADRRKRNGTYASHIWGPPGKRVKIILLDVRYNQRKIKRGSPVTDPKDETMLGEEQWAWFEQEMRDSIAPKDSPVYQKSGAEVVFVVSGLEMISWGKLITEGWRVFHRDRVRLMNLVAEVGATSYERAKLTQTRPVAVLLISGDVHFSEMQRTYMPYNGTFVVDNLNNLPTPVHEASTYPLYQEYAAEGVGKDVLDRVSATLSNKAFFSKNDNIPVISDGSTTTTSPTSLYMMPMTELTTSGVTHGIGEMAGQTAVLGTLMPIITSYLLKPKITGWDLADSTSGGAIAWDAMGIPYFEREIRKKQGNRWVFHNFATVDVDWENDVIAMKIRDKLGNTALDYSIPLAFLRAHDIALLTDADNMYNVPPGVIQNIRSTSGKSYLQGIFHQSQLEWAERIKSADVWEVVEEVRAIANIIGEYKWLILTAIIATIITMAILGNKWRKASSSALRAVSSVMLFFLRCCSPRGYFCCGCLTSKRKKEEHDTCCGTVSRKKVKNA